MVVRAGLYCRISKDSQGTGLGVERQKALCRKLAEDKGWEVARVYSDNDLSAFRGSPRPEYELMLADLESGFINAVVVVDQDRLTRHPSELERFITLADGLGVLLANVSGEVDLSTSEGRFGARIMGALARQESEKKSERLKRQKDQAASAGWAQGGRRRYGYRHTRTEDDKATMEVVPEEAAIVREAASRFLAGESLRSIANDLNDRGIPTATGKTWRVSTLKTMLGGPHIAGLRVHRGEVVGNGNWQPILDRASWEALRAVLGDPRRHTKGRPATYLLTGLLTCGRCGGTLHHGTRTQNGAKVGRYVCSPVVGSGNCGRIAIKAHLVEEYVTTQILGLLSLPYFEVALATRVAPPNDKSTVVQEIESLEKSMERLAVVHFAEGQMSEREYLVARDAIEKRLEGLRTQLVDSEPQSPVSLAGLGSTYWETANIDQRRSLIGKLVREIVIDPGTRGQATTDRIDIRLVAITLEKAEDEQLSLRSPTF